MIVFAMMFVMITLVAGLHHRQSSARSSLFHEEAKLQARLAAEYALARQINPGASFAPESQAVKGSLEQDQERLAPKLVAHQIFQSQSLLDLSQSKPLKLDKLISSRGGLSWNMIKTSTNDPAVRPDKSRYLAVVSDFFPYAACAPQGKITTEDAFAWDNPLFSQSDKVKPATALSGEATRMAAGGDIVVGNLTYGEIFTTNGTVKVSQGRFVAYPGPPGDLNAPDSYPRTIQAQIASVKTRLKEKAQNKTHLFNGNPFTVDAIMKLFKGEGENFLASALSLRQATKFPFFMIPGGRIKGIFVTVWLHMPYAPDGGSADSRVKEVGTKKEAERKEKLDKLEAKQKEIAEIEAKEKAESNAEEKKKLAKAREAAEKEKEKEADGLRDMAGEIENEMESALESSKAESDSGPANRDGETGMGDKGVEGFSYGPFYKKIFDFCVDVIGRAFAGDNVGKILEDWAKTLYQEVRLVHFGGKSFDTDFNLSDSASEFTATFNVPPGRAVAIHTNMKIKGDLWLMRGSSLLVQGNLEVVSPLSDFSMDPRKPRGRIFMEQGSNLVVSGNLTCEGSSALGSILVGAPINKIHPAMTSILVDGDVNIPYGVWPAFSIGDLDFAEVPELETVRDIMSTVVPNLAKVSGPFHRRKPYFSSFATSFLVGSVIIPPVPIPILVPVPLPVPTPDNANVKIFRALSAIYAVQTNLAWGENFITHCDWWFLGQGTVPMFPKINPTVYIDRLKNLKFPTLPSMSEIEKQVTQKGPKLVQEMAPKLITEFVVKLVVSQLTMGFGDVVLRVVPLDDMLKEFLDIEDTQKSLAEIAGLDTLMNTIKSKISDNAVDMFLFETPGILIYAGGNLSIGADLSHSIPVTIGMLVAGKNIVSNAGVTVGAALSLTGDIKLKKLLYDPNSTRASIYIPMNDLNVKVPGLDWLNWAIEVRYGRLYENKTDGALDIGPKFPTTRVQGWMQ